MSGFSKMNEESIKYEAELRQRYYEKHPEKYAELKAKAAAAEKFQASLRHGLEKLHR